jgi:hypothetical protein
VVEGQIEHGGAWILLGIHVLSHWKSRRVVVHLGDGVAGSRVQACVRLKFFASASRQARGYNFSHVLFDKFGFEEWVAVVSQIGFWPKGLGCITGPPERWLAIVRKWVDRFTVQPGIEMCMGGAPQGKVTRPSSPLYPVMAITWPRSTRSPSFTSDLAKCAEQVINPLP